MASPATSSSTVTNSDPIDRPTAPVEPNPRWIRGEVGAHTLVDSRRTRFVWEVPYYPQWYIPIADVSAVLRPTGDVEQTSNRGDATVYDLVIPAGAVGTGEPERVIPAAARRHLDSPVEELRDLVRITWDAVDRWLEEDVEVIVHPRSPYVRVDVLPTSRRVTVKIDGTVVAESTSASMLYETGLPPRYYLPPSDVRTELLTATETSSACPYKGVARYWSVTLPSSDGAPSTVHGDTVHRDIVWGYDNPLPESAAVQGLMCFYNEKVDIEVDGEALEQPKTKFS